MELQQLSAGRGTLTAVRTGEGRDLVVLHSLLTDRHAFDPVLPVLAAKHRVTLFNLPGFHGSQPAMLALMDAYVAVIEDGFDEFGIANDAVLMFSANLRTSSRPSGRVNQRGCFGCRKPLTSCRRISGK